MKQPHWEDIFQTWKEQEDHPSWREHYGKRGFRTWEDWRWSRVKLLGLDKRKWQIEQTDNAIEEAKAMYCDATTVWRKFYTDRMKSTFADVKDHPFFKDHQKVLGMREHFPAGSQMILLRSGKQSIVFDGHHRAVALAGMPEGTPPPDVRLAVTDYGHRELGEFERLFYARFELQAKRKLLDVVGVFRSQLRLGF